MIIFLYGKDGYRLKQNLDRIVGEYKKKHTSGMSFSVLDAGEGLPGNALEKLEDLVKTVSFFNEKRLVVIKNPFLISKELAALIKKWKLAEDKERIIVCAESQSKTELSKKDGDFFILLTAKPNLVKHSESLNGKQLESWIAKELASYDAKIELAAVKKLISRAGNDSWLLAQEINKLTNYNNTRGGVAINTIDVDLLVTSEVNLNIFEIVDAVASRNRLRAAKLLYNHLETGVDPYHVFSTIVYQFRNLVRVKNLIKNAVPYGKIVEKTGLNSFVVKKTYEQCKKYESDELKTLFAQLALIEINTKSGVSNMDDELYRFAFAL